MASTETAVRLTVAEFRAQILRNVLCSVAVALGVGLIVCTSVFHDSLSTALTELAAQETKDADIVISRGEVGSLTAQDVQMARSIPGVTGVQPNLAAPARVLTADGTAMDPAGMPSEARSWPSDWDAVVALPDIVVGTPPSRDDELLLPHSVLDRYGISIGDTVRVHLPDVGRRDSTVTGAYELPVDAGTYIGAMFSEDSALSTFGGDRGYTIIYLSVAPYTDIQTVLAELRQQIPTATVKSGADANREVEELILSRMAPMQQAFQLAALVTVILAVLIVFVSLTTSIDKQKRHLALLRAVGASQRFCISLVLIRSSIIGLLGAIGGIGFGLLLARGLFLAVHQAGYGLPRGPLQVDIQSFLVAGGIGLAATLCSAAIPAVRAGAVTPIDGLRSVDAAPRRRRGALGHLFTTILSGGGLAYIALSVGQPDQTARVVALILGLLLFYAGIYLSIPTVAGILFAVPVALVRRFSSWPMLIIALRDATHNTLRTRSTSFVVIVLISPAIIMAVGGSSAATRVHESLDMRLRSDLVVVGAGGIESPGVMAETLPLSATTVDTATELPAEPELGRLDATVVYYGIDSYPLLILPPSPERFIELSFTSGGMEVGHGGIIVSDSFARERGWTAGGSVTIHRLDREVTHTFPITGVYEDTPYLPTWAIGRADLDRISTPAFSATAMVLLNAVDDAAPNTLKDELLSAIDHDPMVTVATPAELVRQDSAAVRQLLAIVYSMVAAAMLVAVLGILNGMTLIVSERRREFALLRCIGASTRSIRISVGVECMLLIVVGAVTGTAFGLYYGYFLVAGTQGGPVTVSPILLLVTAGACAAAGALAAVVPVIAATRGNPVDGIWKE